MPKFVEVSLNAATALGPGAVITFDPPITHLSMQVVVTGDPDSAEVNLDASIDGVTFAIVSNIDVAPTSSLNGSIVSSGQGVGTAPAITAARANLVELVGGTNPTVTATLAWTDR